MPTLLELGGGTPPADLDGKSLYPLLAGEATTHREVVFATHTGASFGNVYPTRSIRRGQFKLIHTLHPEFVFRCKIDEAEDAHNRYISSWIAAAQNDPAANAIYQAHRSGPQFQLFDLEADPYEFTNLAEESPRTRRR